MKQQNFIVICATARLANGLRWVHDAEQMAEGRSQWAALPALTISQWLDNVIERALLQGRISVDAMPKKVLSSQQEQVLWERVIQRSLPSDSAVLFDLAGMAASAMEANHLMREWDVQLDAHGYAEEVMHFLAWRKEFDRQMVAKGWVDSAHYLDWQIEQIGQGHADLPAQIYYAGMDRLSPQIQRLFEAIQSQGAKISAWSHLNKNGGACEQQLFADSDAECRAIVSWAADYLAKEPSARLGIVVPELDKLRSKLTALFDAVLNPLAISSRFAETPRDYDFSLGGTLSKLPIVDAALRILKISSIRREISQEDISVFWMTPYWGGGFAEADARAQLEAAVRADLPSRISLERFVKFVIKHETRGLLLTHSSGVLSSLFDYLLQLPTRQVPSSVWSASFKHILEVIGWPGDRVISSHEYQARKKFEEILESLGGYDDLLGSITFSEAVMRLQRLCTEQIFQPETKGDPHIFIIGMLETVAKPMDAIWVMGMNDHLWPAQPRPNPLLPASVQRLHRLPGADGSVQAEFAMNVHQRLLQSAGSLIFSASHKDGERELRPSPLVKDIPLRDPINLVSQTMAEKLAISVDKEWIADYQAPPVAKDERVRGGAGLLKAQAICPAWAYYRYRLGARRMDEPVDGLDALGRGTLLHAVLQNFWQGRDSAYLHSLDEATLALEVDKAVVGGVKAFEQSNEETLPPKLVVLESYRLRHLLAAWLAYERGREPFTVEACEKETPISVAGMDVRLTLDRIDRLEDGRLVIIDYKTGANVSTRSWADERITEPQLPLYASIAMLDEQVAAVCFAQVRADAQKFIGLSDEADTLPDVKGVGELAKTFPPEQFSDWKALLHVWKTRIESIATEIAEGHAAVVFGDEAELRDCDVKPILRLPERKLQIEAWQSRESNHD